MFVYAWVYTYACTDMCTHKHSLMYLAVKGRIYLLLKTAAAEYAELELPLLLTSDSSTSSSCPGRLPGFGEGSTRVVTGMGAAVDSHAGSIALCTTEGMLLKSTSSVRDRSNRATIAAGNICLATQK